MLKHLVECLKKVSVPLMVAVVVTVTVKTSLELCLQGCFWSVPRYEGHCGVGTRIEPAEDCRISQ